MRLVEGAVLHDGSLAGLRCQRAALIGAAGSVAELRRFVFMLKIDFRDVIVAGEYEGQGNELRQVRDLSLPFIAGSD